MIEELKRDNLDLRSSIKEQNQDFEEIRCKIEDNKKDQNKKWAQIYREIEKQALNVERKVNIDEFNERIDIKADKQMVVNAVINKPNKVDIDQAINAKADIIHVEKLIKALEIKYEAEIANLNEVVSRKSNVDDI